MKVQSLVCFLAYVLWKTLEQCQQRAGLGHSPRTILEVLGDNYMCALTTITPAHPNGRGAASYLADTPGLRRIQPGANDGRAGEEAHGRDAQAR